METAWASSADRVTSGLAALAVDDAHKVQLHHANGWALPSPTPPATPGAGSAEDEKRGWGGMVGTWLGKLPRP